MGESGWRARMAKAALSTSPPVWNPPAPAQMVPSFNWACWTISRFLYPEGRRSFLWARHCCQALATYPEVERSGPLLLPYLVLLRMGFALPDGSLHPRCALTAPFHPCRKSSLRPNSRRYIFCGTFREIRFERTPPAVSRHAALWRPDFPPAKTVYPPSRRLPDPPAPPPLSQRIAEM